MNTSEQSKSNENPYVCAYFLDPKREVWVDIKPTRYEDLAEKEYYPLDFPALHKFDDFRECFSYWQDLEHEYHLEFEDYTKALTVDGGVKELIYGRKFEDDGDNPLTPKYVIGDQLRRGEELIEIVYVLALGNKDRIFHDGAVSFPIRCDDGLLYIFKFLEPEKMAKSLAPTGKAGIIHLKDFVKVN